MVIQYVGFQLKPRGREYAYRVVDMKNEAREFTLIDPAGFKRSFQTPNFAEQLPDAVFRRKLALPRGLVGLTARLRF